MKQQSKVGIGLLQPTKKWIPGESLLGLMARGDIEFLGHRGLRINAELPREVWREGFKALIGWHDGLPFFLGDMLIHAEFHYGDKYTWAIEECMREEQTLKNYVRVCRAIPPERRFASPLSFSHHEAVAKLPPEQQTEWLLKAQANDMTREDLRSALRRSGKTLDGPEVPRAGLFVLEGPPMDFMRWVNRDLARRMPDLVRNPTAKEALRTTLTQVIRRCEQICASL